DPDRRDARGDGPAPAGGEGVPGAHEPRARSRRRRARGGRGGRRSGPADLGAGRGRRLGSAGQADLARRGGPQGDEPFRRQGQQGRQERRWWQAGDRVRRLFWVALGLGAGAASAILASRFVRKQTAKVAPVNLAREARGGMMDLAKLVSDSLAEGKAAMQQKEDELRSELR